MCGKTEALPVLIVPLEPFELLSDSYFIQVTELWTNLPEVESDNSRVMVWKIRVILVNFCQHCNCDEMKEICVSVTTFFLSVLFEHIAKKEEIRKML